MAKIISVRPVLLSAPYADRESNLEVQIHLPTGYRTCGMVEIKTDDGLTGLGEGYVAVFAPEVFRSLIELLGPYLVGKDIRSYHRLYKDITTVTGYWSLQGAARHAVSAVEIALQDLRAQSLGMPVYQMLGGATQDSIQLYGSGGDSVLPEAMLAEMDYLNELGISIFKIRARNHEAQKAAWCLVKGRERGIHVAIDMAQNLATPGQSVSDVTLFLDKLERLSGSQPFFIEEVLGPSDLKNYITLKSRVKSRIAGGEIVTTTGELQERIRQQLYDLVQPDATVIGGIADVIKVFDTAVHYGSQVVVHCWGGPVGMMANYHAAFAGGGTLAEWPMPDFVLRRELVSEPWNIREGRLTLPSTPSLGVRLTPEIEKKYPYRPDSAYACLAHKQIDANNHLWEL